MSLEKEVYTPGEIASLLRIQTETVYRMVKRGDLKAFKVGFKIRIRRDAVEDYMRRAAIEVPAGDPKGKE